MKLKRFNLPDFFPEFSGPNLKTNVFLAADKLNAGEIVAFPTETVYGLGADATKEEAVRRIFVMKGRPSFNPLICHIATFEKAHEMAHVNEKARKLMEHFWPGPLTLVLKVKKNSGLAPSCTAGLDTVALRIPDHPLALDLLTAFSLPIAAPSANKSGGLSLLRSKDILEEFKEFHDFNILEEYVRPQIGLESTIIDLSSSVPILLRSGFIEAESVEKILKETVRIHVSNEGEPLLSPGMMLRHYAPKRGLITDCTTPDLGFGEINGSFNLSKSGNLVEAAQNLYMMLKDLDDSSGEGEIKVAPIPDTGIGIAINDRLKRASYR